MHDAWAVDPGAERIRLGEVRGFPDRCVAKTARAALDVARARHGVPADRDAARD